MKTVTPLFLPNVRQFIIRHLYFIALALALAGCTTSLIRVDLSKIDAPPAGKASILVIRPSYLTYAARDLSITVNNSKIADLVNLSYTSFLMPPGKLNLSSKGWFFSWPAREITINVEAGQTYYLTWIAQETASSALMRMLFPVMDMDALHWELLSKDRAQALLDSTHYVKPTMLEITK